MADFRIDPALFLHPKYKRLKRALGLEGAESLFRLWAHARLNNDDGQKVYSADDIELAVDWAGEPGSLASVLAAVRFVDEVPGGYVIHNWAKRNGYAATAAKRSEVARENANKRWNKRQESGRSADAMPNDANGNAAACEPQSDGNTAAMPTHADGNAPSPFPSPLPSPSPKKKKDSILHALPTTDDREPYRTKKGRKLAGQKWEWFKRFWAAFAYQVGKTEAADAWLDIKNLTPELVDRIVQAATAEAAAREEAKAQGKTPKMAQGWLNGRRWEDEAVSTPPSAEISLAAVEAALAERAKRSSMQ